MLCQVLNEKLHQTLEESQRKPRKRPKLGTCHYRAFNKPRNVIILIFHRARETSDETRQRLDRKKDYYHNQSEEKKEENLAQKRQNNQKYRGQTEKPLRRSTRLEADRANKRIQQAAKSSCAREKDAHEKWKQRYKK